MLQNDVFSLFLHENWCCNPSTELPHWDSSNEWVQLLLKRNFLFLKYCNDEAVQNMGCKILCTLEMRKNNSELQNYTYTWYFTPSWPLLHIWDCLSFLKKCNLFIALPGYWSGDHCISWRNGTYIWHVHESLEILWLSDSPVRTEVSL